MNPHPSNAPYRSPIDGLGKSLNASSYVSFSVSEGMLNAIYFPREDAPCSRGLQLIVTRGTDFYSNEMEDTDHQLSMEKDGIPIYRIMNGCKEGQYGLEKEIVADPLRHTVLQQVRFYPVEGNVADYRLFALLDPYGRQTGWIERYKGVPMLFAHRKGVTLAFACSYPWKKRSVDLADAGGSRHYLEEQKQMNHENAHVTDQQLVLTGEIDLSLIADTFLLGVGFGKDQEEAALQVWSSIVNGFGEAKNFYAQEWEDWQKGLESYGRSRKYAGGLFRMAAANLRMHEAKSFPGAMVSGVLVPEKGDYNPPPYQQVWIRDLIESAEALFAAGAGNDGERVLNFITATQEADGSWPQSMWLSGAPYRDAVQLEEVARAVLLIDLCRSKQLLHPDILFRYATLAQRSADYLIRATQYTSFDSEVEEQGYRLATMAVTIAALLAAATFAQKDSNPNKAKYYRESADYLNERLEELSYVQGTPLAQEVGVDGYYICFNPYADEPANRIKGRSAHIGGGAYNPDSVVSTDVFELVRCGLRAPDDPRILNSIKVNDHVLKKETPYGPCWRQNNFPDSVKIQGNERGIRPLLIAERAHYELSAGDVQKARDLTRTLEAFAHNGLIPAYISDKESTFRAQAEDAVKPLLQSQAEYLKLCISLKGKKIYDMPDDGKKRYITQQQKSRYAVWRFEDPRFFIPRIRRLRIEVKAPATVRFSLNNWDTVQEMPTVDTNTGIYKADLPKINKKGLIHFTFYWHETDQWEGRNFQVVVQ